MRKIVFASLLMIFSVTLRADADAALQMRLAQQTKFQQRVAYNLMQQAFVVLAEGSGVTNHANRMIFAVKVRDNINDVIQSGFVTALVGRPNLVSATTTCDDTGPNPTFECTTNATDASIFNQIASDWNLWANNQ